MTVPMGAIYGPIRENGSGKSTTEKLICGLIHPSGGTIKLFDKSHSDADVRAKMGVLIEAPGCFPNYSVWNNMMLQAANLGIPNAEELEASCRTYVALQAKDMNRTKALLGCKYSRVEDDENGYLRVYDAVSPEQIVTYLYENGILVSEIKTDKIGLEEYYIDLMKEDR